MGQRLLGEFIVFFGGPAGYPDPTQAALRQLYRHPALETREAPIAEPVMVITLIFQELGKYMSIPSHPGAV